MDDGRLLRLNGLIQKAYECSSFADFLKLAITGLHTLVMYDSGVFYCAISRDSSFFRPYLSGSMDDYYNKRPFDEREAYLERNEAGREALVFKAADYRRGLITVPAEPRNEFLSSQEEYHVACLRILYKDQFLGEVYLHRNRDKPDFDEQDLFVLRLLQPHISNVFHFIHTFDAVKLLETDKTGLDKKGLCLFDSDMNLVSANVAGLELLNNATVFGSSVLFHLKEIMKDMMESKASDGQPLSCETHKIKTPGGDLSAEVILNIKNRGRRGGSFHVALEAAGENQLASEYRFKFTERELDMIDGIIQGKSNRQIAEMRNLSGNTVKTHIQKIFKKAGVSSRSELVYLLMLNRK